MKAEEMRVGPILTAHRQYVVPYFQRTYSWRRQQWVTLFDDIVELEELGKQHTHFLGSMVLLAESATEAIPTSLVIDGQQRLVTLSLFLAAMRDLARETNEPLAQRIHSTFLVTGAQGAEDDQLRVLCTHQDRAAFGSVILRGQEPQASPIGEAYRTFGERLAEQVQRGTQIDTLLEIITSQLSLVAISLDQDDNPYRIFESLNAKGMPLTQSDLLRNYFFMRLPPPEHERCYTTVWFPMQRRLGDRFDAFMRDFLLKDGGTVRPDEVYQEWRKRLGPLGEDDVRETLRDLAAWSLEYEAILHPQREKDATVRAQLAWLTAWSRTLPQPIDPLILRLNADYRRGDLTAEQAKTVFSAVGSFLVRRMFAGVLPADDNQLLIGLYSEAAKHADRADAFVQALAGSQHGWPNDEDFIAGVTTYPVYFSSHPDRRKLILQGLEESFPHPKGPVRYEQLDLQLITPLMPRPDWLAELGVSESQYWKTIGTLGNLTWVPHGRLPDLGVAERKKELVRMARYGLELTRDFSKIERWSAEEIEARSKRMAERAVSVWPGPPH
jgi:hypothetical protein